MNYSSLFVCLMGMGTVFFGLVCLICLTYLMGKMVKREKRTSPAHSQISEIEGTYVANAPSGEELVAVITAALAAEINSAAEMNGDMAAVISSAIAQELGTGTAGVRILSINKI